MSFWSDWPVVEECSNLFALASRGGSHSNRKQANEQKELRTIEQHTNDSINYIQSLGLKLPDVVLDMAKWITIKRYAERHGLTTQVVTNWIARGVIPADCVKDVPELNDLRLVKNQPYR